MPSFLAEIVLGCLELASGSQVTPPASVAGKLSSLIVTSGQLTTSRSSTRVAGSSSRRRSEMNSFDSRSSAVLNGRASLRRRLQGGR